jgi:hypothetical protein
MKDVLGMINLMNEQDDFYTYTQSMCRCRTFCRTLSDG